MRPLNRFIGASIFWLIVVTVSVIAVANRKHAILSFDPFNADAPALAFQVPLYAIILGAALIGLVLGGWSSWLAQAPQRRAARAGEQKIKRLEREIEVQQALIVRPTEGRALDTNVR